MDTEPEGDTLQVCVPVYLGDLEPTEIRVELYAEAIAGRPRECCALTLSDTISGAINGYHYRGHIPSDRPIEDFTARAVPAFDGARAPLESKLIFWQR
jgi:glycogen phosphorylase